MELENFCSYLEEIGIVDVNSLNIFLDVYSSIKALLLKGKSSSQEKNFSTKHFICPLLKFLKNYYLNDESKLEDLCKRIVDNYKKNEVLKKFKILTNFEKLLKNRLNNYKLSSFYALKSIRGKVKKIRNRLNNLQTESARSQKNVSNTFFTDNNINTLRTLASQELACDKNSFKFNTKSEANSGDEYIKLISNTLPNKLSSKEKNELLNLSQCTFRPIINKKKANHRTNSLEGLNTLNTLNIFDKLYTDSKVRNDKKQQNLINYYKKESNDYTFQPSSISNPKYKRNRSTNSLNILASSVNLDSAGNSSKSYSRLKLNRKIDYSFSFSQGDRVGAKNNFLSKSEKGNNLRKDKLRAMVVNKQNETDNLYTFTPKINKSCEVKSIGTVPRYLLLNNEHKLKEERLNKKRIEIYEKNSNFFNSSRNLKRSRSFNNISVIIHSNYYEKLYEDANKMKDNKIRLSNRLYKDVTFSPKTNSEKTPIKVNSTFEERSQKLLDLKKELLNKLKKQEEDELNNKKIPSKKEIDANNKNVIERLYDKGMERIREKHSKLEDEKQEMIKKLKKEHKIKFKVEDNKKKPGPIQNYIKEKVEYNSILEDLEKKLAKFKLHTINSEEISSEKVNSENTNEDERNKSQIIIANMNNEALSKSISDHSNVSVIIKTSDSSNPNIIEKNFRSKALLNILKNRGDNSLSQTSSMNNEV